MNIAHPSLEDTKYFVQYIFSGVTDKVGRPYYEHCLNVMLNLPDDASDNEKHAALLHDVFEDTTIDAAKLKRMGYSDEVISFVSLLTRNKNEPYETYIRSVKGSKVERIKRADLQDNTQRERLLSLPDLVRHRLVKKYECALAILDGE